MSFGILQMSNKYSAVALFFTLLEVFKKLESPLSSLKPFNNLIFILKLFCYAKEGCFRNLRVGVHNVILLQWLEYVLFCVCKCQMNGIIL